MSFGARNCLSPNHLHPGWNDWDDLLGSTWHARLWVCAQPPLSTQPSHNHNLYRLSPLHTLAEPPLPAYTTWSSHCRASTEPPFIPYSTARAQRPTMDSSPFGTPSAQSIQEPPTTPLARDFAQHAPFAGVGSFTPTPSTRTDVPLLPTTSPGSPERTYSEKKRRL